MSAPARVVEVFGELRSAISALEAVLARLRQELDTDLGLQIEPALVLAAPALRAEPTAVPVTTAATSGEAPVLKMYTPARQAVLQETWPAGVPTEDVCARLNELPGKPMSLKQVMDYASVLSLFRPPGFARKMALLRQQKLLTRACTAGASDAKLPVRTPERDALLRREWPKGTHANDILPLYNALPGKKVEAKRIAVLAAEVGVKRQAGFVPEKRLADSARKPAQPPERACRSPTRDAIVRLEWPAGTPVAEIVQLLNELPGKKLVAANVKDIAKAIGVRRGRPAAPVETQPSIAEKPAGISKARESLLRRHWPTDSALEKILALVNMQEGPAVTLAELAPIAQGLGLQRPAAKAAAVPAVPKAPAPKIAGFVKQVVVANTPAPAVLTAAQKRRQEEERLIAEHLARKGVTKCPAACADVTTHVPSSEDAAAMRKINDEREAARQAEMGERRGRVQSNRVARLTGKPQAAHGARP
jgi:hypothetical protein